MESTSSTAKVAVRTTISEGFWCGGGFTAEDGSRQHGRKPPEIVKKVETPMLRRG